MPEIVSSLSSLVTHGIDSVSHSAFQAEVIMIHDSGFQSILFLTLFFLLLITAISPARKSQGYPFLALELPYLKSTKEIWSPLGKQMEQNQLSVHGMRVVNSAKIDDLIHVGPFPSFLASSFLLYLQITLQICNARSLAALHTLCPCGRWRNEIRLFQAWDVTSKA